MIAEDKFDRPPAVKKSTALVIQSPTIPTVWSTPHAKPPTLALIALIMPLATAPNVFGDLPSTFCNCGNTAFFFAFKSSSLIPCVWFSSALIGAESHQLDGLVLLPVESAGYSS